MWYSRFDPNLNMDLCCCGLMPARRGVMIIGSLELLAAGLILLKVLATSSLTGQWQIPTLVAVGVIFLANYATIPLMFRGIRRQRATLLSWHLIVHVVNIIGLVFLLLMSATFFEATPHWQQAVGYDNDTDTLPPSGSDFDELGQDSSSANTQWIVQIALGSLCLVVETWFFNIEYSLFIQLCKRDSNMQSSSS